MMENSLTEDTLKRPSTPEENPPKKVRLTFNASEFRKQIKNEQKTQALQKYLQLINESTKQDVILTYFEKGGSILEILRLIEGESDVSPVLVFDIVNRILLQVSTKLPQYQSSAYDACRYLLNNFISLINKMLGLSSSTKERVITLKLLTTIVTCSAVLAKDVLLYVNFNPTNVELLTKATESKNEVRSAFIHFIVAFLVDGHFPALSVLLEKKGLMTSIINGLQYDKADVVVLVLTAMKNCILENGAVTKTTKMRTFNTLIVKDIVNLYNWKGPSGLGGDKNKTKTVIVDEVDKTKVNEAVHFFLLVLCTSHKFGVIFKDPMVGLTKRQNPLMFTVLESLERPWEHSYAGDLVTKICRACPDLAKTMWNNLKPFLELRWTVKWLKAVQFAHKLLDGLQPESIDGNCLNNHQMTQIITSLTSPISILKMLIPENQTFGQPSIKFNVISLILKMVESIEKFLKYFDNEILTKSVTIYIEKNFPGVDFILTDWDVVDSDCSVSEYLNTALDLLQKYKILAPKILDEASLNIELTDFMSRAENLDDILKIKAINFFIALEPTQFRPKNELFETVLTFSLEFYFRSRDPNVLKVLNLLLKNSTIFDGFDSEVNFWIDGVLNLKSYDENISVFLCHLVRKIDENSSDYHKKLFTYENANFSPMVLALCDFDQTNFSKSVKNYLNFVLLNLFHIQSDIDSFIKIVSEFDFLPTTMSNYFQNWKNCTVATLEKCKGPLMEEFSKFSRDFLENTIDDVYLNFKLNLLQIVIFYLTNLTQMDSLKDNHKKNCQKFIDFLFNENLFDDEAYVRTVLGNPTIIQNVTLHTSNNFSTKLVVDFIKRVKTPCLENYLIALREKVVASVLRILRKPQKYQDSCISLELIETIGLNSDHCSKIITKFVSSVDNKNFFFVASHCLSRMAQFGEKSLSNETITELTKFLSYLIKEDVSNLNQFSVSLYNYLKVFPQNLEGVDNELFVSLVQMTEFNKDNLTLCEFLLERIDYCWSVFVEKLDEICSKKGFILSLLDVVIQRKQSDDVILEKIYNNFQTHIIKVLQKPHKAGQHFQNRHRSVGILIEKFMKPDGFGNQIQKFETTELFHVYLLKKVFDKVEKNDKTVNNMIMTFIHLVVALLKQKKDNLQEICQVFYEFLTEIENYDIILSNNETFKTFYKLCLKNGVSGDFVLLKILAELVRFCSEDDAKLTLEMLMSHSEFLDVVLGDYKKDELLNLWLIVCTKWPQFMERNHVPVLLSAYKATKADATALKILKMYESKAFQTKFFDFKPFLWGRAAASHYSVRSDYHKVLWRQPKTADVLNNLHLGTIISTINDPNDENSYDLDYFLPLFSNLLSPENPVATYHFSKSGALALTLVGLRGDKSHRLATCHILQRFYFHLEARQTGKDNLLWLRFIEAICKGIAIFDDFKTNNFVGVFLARTALILAQPNHVMYVPLTQYLTAKDSLDFSTVPELYTFLHSPQVDSKEHKHFILEVLRDGLKNDTDFAVLLKSMAFKLISELCSSGICDTQTKILILEIFQQCCKIPMGVKILCGSLSFLSQMFSLVLKEIREGSVVVKLLDILLKIVEVDKDRHRNFVIYLNMMTIAENEHYFQCLNDSRSVDILYQILYILRQRFSNFFICEHLELLKGLNGKLYKKLEIS